MTLPAPLCQDVSAPPVAFSFHPSSRLSFISFSALCCGFKLRMVLFRFLPEMFFPFLGDKAGPLQVLRFLSQRVLLTELHSL